MTAQPQTRDIHKDELNALLAGRPIVLVGMMGAGKTTVGRRLAAKLGRHFVDSDEEVEKAAGMRTTGVPSRHWASRPAPSPTRSSAPTKPW